MDFNQLLYFITIVESNFNLTLAAEKIHISQPALSKFILKFEDEHGVELFYRRKGRLIALTKAGEIIYQGALKIQADYTEIINSLDNLSQYYGGTVNIGIPPLILSTLFTELVPRMVNVNPNVRFNIIEIADLNVQTELEQYRLDFGVILYPSTINNKLFNETIIYQDRLSAFVNDKHELVKKKDSLSWEDLDGQDFILASSDFNVRRQINEKFKKYAIKPIIKYETTQSTYAIEMLKHSNFITVLPNPLKQIVNLNNITVLDINKPIDWIISLVYPKKEAYSRLEKYIVHTITHYFQNQGDILSIQETNLSQLKNRTN